MRRATRLLHDEKCRLRIDAEGAIKILFSHLYERLLDDHASIVDHDIYAPKGVKRLTLLLQSYLIFYLKARY